MRCIPTFLPLAVLALALLASLSQLPSAGGVVFSRGGGKAGLPPTGTLPGCGGNDNDDGNKANQPPIGEVVGAGAVGVLAGQVIFQSLVISAGLGLASMSVAASSADGPGEIARSSGRMAVAVFDRVTQLNSRYQLTDRFVDGAKMAGWRLRKFDQEHAVVHRATQGTKKALLEVQEFNEAHGVTAKAGETVSSSLDKLTEVLTPPSSSTATDECTSGSGSGSGSSSSSGSTGSDICNEEPYKGIGGSRITNNSGKGTNNKINSRSASKRKKKREDRKKHKGRRTRRSGVGRGAGKGSRDWAIGSQLLPSLDRDEAERWFAEFRENGRRWIDENEILDM